MSVCGIFFYVFCFFFFKQKTAYEMRISDWSSDVCSSDLHTDCTGGNRHPDTAIAHQQPTAYENSHKHHHGCQEGLAWRKAAQSKTYQQHRQTGQQGGLPVLRRLHPAVVQGAKQRSEEHTSELQSLMRISYAVFGLKT